MPKELTPAIVSDDMQVGWVFVWNDPDYIEENDYTINSIEYPKDVRDDPNATVTIEYNGYQSIADVPMFEIQKLK